MIFPLTAAFTCAASNSALAEFSPTQLSDVCDALRLYVSSTEDMTAPPLTLTVSIFALNARPGTVAEAQAGVTIMPATAIPAVTANSATAGTRTHSIQVVIPLAFRIDPAARYLAVVITAPAGPDWTGLAVLDVFRVDVRPQSD